MNRLILTVFLFASLMGKAQQLDNVKRTENGRLASLIIDTSYKHRGSTIYATLPTITFMQTPNLNSILANQQIPTLNTTVFFVGFGIEERWNRLSVMFDIQRGQRQKENQQFDVVSNTNLTSISLKYYVVKSKNGVGIYPLLGVTELTQYVNITDKSNTVDINTMLGKSGATNLLLNTSFITSGIGIDFFDLTNEESFFGSFRIGYRTNILPESDNKWSIVNSPSEKLNALSIQISIGYSFNEFSKKQKRIF